MFFLQESFFHFQRTGYQFVVVMGFKIFLLIKTCCFLIIRLRIKKAQVTFHSFLE